MWEAAGGLLLGLVSSFHCVGMCGPLAMALPVHDLPRVQRLAATSLYHAGRVLTYATAGALFGWAGRGIYIAGFQQWFAIAMGFVMLLLAVLNFTFHHSGMPAWLQPFYLKVQQVMHRLLRSPKSYNFLLLGMANGLLPCGMVYMAIAGALSTSSVMHGVLFMGAFGAGTLPAMIALSLFGIRFKLSHRRQIRQLMPYIVAGMAILFILRGMNLGIPFISPVLPDAPKAAVLCH